MRHVLSKFRLLSHHSAPYRTRFGTLYGWRLWHGARRSYKLPHNTLYPLRIPGLKHLLWLRAGTCDIGVLQQVICGRETEFELHDAPTEIIDAGANIGLFSVMMAERFPDCRIIALEVERSNFELLRRNVAPYPNIIPMQRALWRSSGYVRITDPTAQENAFTVVETTADDPHAIAAVSVDALMAELDCSELGLLKMDIEGSELEVLAAPDAKWASRTRAMLVELHDRMRPGCSDALDGLVAQRRHVRSRHGEYHLVRFIGREA